MDGSEAIGVLRILERDIETAVQLQLLRDVLAAQEGEIDADRVAHVVARASMQAAGHVEGELPSASKRGVKPYPAAIATPVVASASLPKTNIGLPRSLKLPLLIVSADSITPKS